MRRKEECLRHWQSVLSEEEYKLESGQDNLCHLMTELRNKDYLLVEKDLIIGNKDKEMDDVRREAHESVKQEVEVC